MRLVSGLLALLTILAASDAHAQREDIPCSQREYPEVVSEETRQLLCRVEGTVCERVRKEHSPNPDSAESGVYYEATEAAIKVCRGLGCIAHPDPARSPTEGVCGIPKKQQDCAGLDTDINSAIKQYGGRCGEEHEKLDPIVGFHPERLLLTGSIVMDSGGEGGKGFESGFAVGFLYQVSLFSSSTERMPNGGLLHHALPTWYLHVGGYGSDDKVGHDLGSAWKTGAPWVSRVGLTFTGQLARSPTNKAIYRAGPGGHLEIYYNILIKGGALLIGNGDGPLWTVSIEYNYDFLNDFKNEPAKK